MRGCHFNWRCRSSLKDEKNPKGAPFEIPLRVPIRVIMGFCGF